MTVCGLFEWKRICAGFSLLFILLLRDVRDQVIKKEGLGSH